jgi:hypothetical protein
MKRFMPLFVWFCAGAILGQMAETVLFRLWSKLGILMPVAHWLDGVGGNVLVNCWFIFWVNATSWFLAAVIGILGGVFVKNHLVRYLVSFGVGFAIVPITLHSYLNSEVPPFNSVLWHIVSIALVVLCGVLSHRRKEPRSIARGSTATAP